MNLTTSNSQSPSAVGSQRHAAAEIPSQVLTRSGYKPHPLESLHLDTRIHLCGRRFQRTPNGPDVTWFCGNPWLCSQCCQIHFAPIRRKLRERVMPWVEAGGRYAMVTIDLRHDRGVPLDEQIDEVDRLRKKLFTRRHMRKAKEAYGIVVEYWVREIADPRGWNPHFHLLLRAPEGTTNAAMQRYTAELTALIGEMPKRRNGFQPVAVSLIPRTRIERAIHYLTKGSASTLRSLISALENGIAYAAPRLRELFKCTKGITQSYLNPKGPKLPELPQSTVEAEEVHAAPSSSTTDSEAEAKATSRSKHQWSKLHRWARERVRGVLAIGKPRTRPRRRRNGDPPGAR